MKSEQFSINRFICHSANKKKNIERLINNYTLNDLKNIAFFFTRHRFLTPTMNCSLTTENYLHLWHKYVYI